jgi:hypothetical protein
LSQINQLNSLVARLVLAIDHHNAVDAWSVCAVWASILASDCAERLAWPNSISTMQP